MGSRSRYHKMATKTASTSFSEVPPPDADKFTFQNYFSILGNIKLFMKDAKDPGKPVLLKGGLLDRSLLSWIRILFVTAVWWSFVAGFFCLCFYMTHMMLYGTADYDNRNQPYFIRNFNKYPGIFYQPGLNFQCNAKSCASNKILIAINKIYNFIPDPYSISDDTFNSKIKPKLREMGIGNLTDDSAQVFVTCEGADEVSKLLLDGMKVVDGFGFSVSNFPWTENKDWSERVVLDFRTSYVVENMIKAAVKLDCVAWAKNIDQSEMLVDKGLPYGGVGKALLCFKEGQLDKLGNGHTECM